LIETISLCVDGLKIMGEVHYPQQAQGPHPALCLCHGIPAKPPDLTDRGYPLLAERFSNEGFITLIFNFRGAGQSEGNLDILGWTRDLEAMLTYLSQIEGVDCSRLSLMGFSGGAATAVYVAARDQKVSAVVTCACPAEFSIFTNGGESLAALVEQCRTVGTIKNDDFPPSLEEWGDNFETVSPINWIEKVSPRPLLIIHGANDELIDPAHAQKLYDRAKEPKEMMIVPGGEHRLRTNEAVISKALVWLKKVNRGVS